MNIVINGQVGWYLIISIIIIAFVIIIFMVLSIIMMVLVAKRISELIKTLSDTMKMFKEKSSDLLNQTTNTIKSVESSLNENQNSKGAFLFKKVFNGILIVSEIIGFYNIIRKRGKDGKRG